MIPFFVLVKSLSSSSSSSEKELLDRTQRKLVSLWNQGLLEHGEACSLDLLKVVIYF